MSLVRQGLWVSAAMFAVSWTPTTIGATPNNLSESSAPVASVAPASAQWNLAKVGQLIESIEASRAEGLNPSNYGVAGLRRAAEQGEGPTLDAAANRAALMLAHDYAFGRVSDRSDMGWMIHRSAEEEAQLPARLQGAIASGEIRSFYASLLPNNERYTALRDALAQTNDPAMRDRLRVNMERWRWMPRGLASNYIYVNVPSYQLQVIDGGASVASFDVVVGSPKTRTPQLVSPTSSLVVNPWWNVPQSIVKSSNLRPGRGGYIFKASTGGMSVRQPPGPKNALGKIKFNLMNDQAIYLHDTPAKAAFSRDERALSHGCIRVKDIDQLASQLMSDDGGDPSRLDEALATTQTATLRLPRTWQVYIVYFTADAVSPGNLVTYADPYGYDAEILARLDGRPMEVADRPLQVAAR